MRREQHQLTRLRNLVLSARKEKQSADRKFFCLMRLHRPEALSGKVRGFLGYESVLLRS